MTYKKAICWFFGCISSPVGPGEPFYCARCGEYMSYESLAGITRWAAVKDWCHYWMMRRWFPKRCGDCGSRYGDHDGCLPF